MDERRGRKPSARAQRIQGIDESIRNWFAPPRSPPCLRPFIKVETISGGLRQRRWGAGSKRLSGLYSRVDLTWRVCFTIGKVEQRSYTPQAAFVKRRGDAAGAPCRGGREETIVATGTVKWFSDQKGFGFITPEDGGDDLFVHHSNIDAEGFRTLTEGQQVEYEEGQGRKGPEATKVRPP